MTRPRIVEVKRRLDGSESRFDCEQLLLEPGERAIVLYVLDRPWPVAGVALRGGIRTYAHFWRGRPFNVYHWVDGDRTVGHYFNIGTVDELAPGRVVWTDYAVDVLATPDGVTRVLDEEELGPETPDAIREIVDAARARILADLPELVREVETETRRLRAAGD